MKHTLLTALVVFAVAASFAAAPQKPRTPEALFGAAQHQEEVQGNLEAAIAGYKRVLAEAGSNRALAARAHYRIGVCYERLGKEEARKSFERIVAAYPDQREVAEQARARLAAMARGRIEPGIHTRQVWTGNDVDTEGSVSPDGNYLSFTDWNTFNLAIRDLRTGEKRQVTRDGSANANPLRSIFSPDGKQIAYWWEASPRELRIINVDGSSRRTLFSVPGSASIMPWDWSADGKYILVGLWRRHPEPATELTLVSVADGKRTVVKSADKRLWEARLSRDGRYVAYTRERDIYLCTIDGRDDKLLVGHPATESLLGWSPDGQRLLFTSDRSGTNAIWSIAVTAGAPRGEPELLKNAAGNISSMGFTNAGTLVYSLETSSEDVYAAGVDLKQGSMTSAPKSVRQSFAGSNMWPDFSPDGRYLGYVSERSRGNHVLVIQSLETGRTTRELPIPLLVSYRNGGWHPDGRSYLLLGGTDDGTAGLYRLALDTGGATLLASTREMDSNFFGPLSPDGKTLYSRHSDPQAGMYRMDLATKRAEILFKPAAGENLGQYSPALSPDGKLEAFRISAPGEMTLAVMPTTGGPVTRLLTLKRPLGFTYQYPFTFSPDGKDILYIGCQENPLKCGLWRIAVTGGEPVRLGDLPPTARNLRVHPNGHLIAFRAGQRAAEVWAMENFLPTTTTIARRRP